jgi:pyrroline-5-carboxylate reductase
MKQKITIIGGGNMGLAIAEGLLSSGLVRAESLTISNPELAKLKKLQKAGVVLTTYNREAITKANVVILAVKPQILSEVLEEIKDSLSQKQFVISIAAGVSLSKIEQVLGKRSIARVMPNICATVAESTSVWAKNKFVTQAQVSALQKILGSFGKVFEVKTDADIDAATAIMGSGPAYVFYLAELLSEKGLQLGLPKESTSLIVHQMIFGSATMLQKNTKSAAELRAAVTSKGGTTEAAFTSFAKSNFSKIFKQGIDAAVRRAKELNKGQKK